MGRKKAQAPADQETVEVTFDDIIEEGVEIALATRATGVCVAVIHHPGGRLPPPLDSYFSGIGGYEEYGVAFITEWRKEQEPYFVTPDQRTALDVCAWLDSLKEVRWRFTMDSLGQAVPDLVSPDDLLTSDPEVEPTLRIKQRTRAPNGLGGGLPQRSSSRGKRSGTRRTPGT